MSALYNEHLFVSSKDYYKSSNPAEKKIIIIIRSRNRVPNPPDLPSPKKLFDITYTSLPIHYMVWDRGAFGEKFLQHCYI